MSPMPGFWSSLFRALVGAVNTPVRPKAVDDAIARDGLTPEQLDDYYRNGGGIAPPDAPHIDEGADAGEPYTHPFTDPYTGDTTMSNERGGKGQGQQKLHTIENAVTGEAPRQITQEEWRTNGMALRAMGWTRPDEDEGEEEAETETPTPEPPADGTV